MRIAYPNQADVAKALTSERERAGHAAYARPYNRWQWDDSRTWWVVPVPTQPTFQYAKVIASASGRLAAPGTIFVGLYVEKGVGPAAEQAGYYPPEMVLGPSWHWHSVIRALSEQSLGEAVAVAAGRIGEPVEVRLDAHVPVVEGRERPPHDTLAFECSDGVRLAATQPPSFSTAQGFLRSAAESTTLVELAAALQDMPEGDWAWVNLRFGRSCETSGPPESPALGASQVSERLLEPFSRWLV